MTSTQGTTGGGASVLGVSLGGVPANISADPNMATDSLAQQEQYAMTQWNDPKSGLQTYFQNTYPDLMWMTQIPGMAEILVGGAVNGWGQGIVDGLLSQNSWWQQNSSSARAWIQQKAQDPASANQTIDQNKALVTSEAQTLGLNLTDAQLTDFANQASMFQWNSDEIKQHVEQSYKAPTDGTAAPGGGDIAQMRLVAQQTAGDYLATPSESDINYWTQTAINGGQTPAQMQAELQNYLGEKDAKLYPWLSTAIQHGITPKSYLAPYTNAAASTLAVSSDSINWSDPKWQGALLQTDPKTGLQNPVNADQFNKNLMQDPTFGYSKTAGAIQKAYQTANQIESTFGKTKQ